VLGRRL